MRTQTRIVTLLCLGSSKMKDWDKEQSDSGDEGKIQVDSEEEGGDEGW